MNKIIIVAECGISHAGSMETAERMIRLAKSSGADLVKFQLWDAEKLWPNHKIAVQGRNWWDEVVKTQLSFDEAAQLFNYGKLEDIEVFFSVFDTERVGWCETIGVKRYKIASGQRNNKELRTACELTGKPVIISARYDFADCTHLYCVPEYPTPLDHLKMPRLFNAHGNLRYNGYSDHTEGITAAVVAMGRGATMIEVHFALPDSPPNPDIICSKTPDELDFLCKLRNEIEEIS